MDNKEISDFYDDFSAAQEETGVNERLISLYKRMKKLGLNANSQILELGCGVGAFTKLLVRTVKSGKIESVDLSPKSIAAAKKNVKNPRVEFYAADVVNYTPKGKSFQFITLMDVIEHIPLHRHPELFTGLPAYMDEETLLLINIPNPYYIDYLIRNECDDMQIIDQPVWFANMVENIEQAGLEIIFFEKYSIWNFEDYDFFIIRKKRKYHLQKIGELQKFSEKAIHKIKTKAERLRYR